MKTRGKSWTGLKDVKIMGRAAYMKAWRHMVNPAMKYLTPRPKLAGLRGKEYRRTYQQLQRMGQL